MRGAPRDAEVGALGIAGCVVSYAAVTLSGWLILLVFPIAYAIVLVRTW